MDLDKLSRYSVRNDRWDRIDRDEAVNEITTFAEDREAFAHRITTGEPLYDDTFFTLLKVQPKVLDAHEVRPMALISRTVMGIGMGLPEWERLRDLGTVGDVAVAAMATTLLSDDIARIWESLQDLVEQAQALEDQMSGGGGSGEPTPDQAEALAQLQRDLEDGSGRIRVPLAMAMGQAADSIDQQQQLVDAWGFDPGWLQELPINERLALAARIQKDPMLRKVSELLGVTRKLAFAELRKRIPRGVDELVGLTTGKDLARALPSELARLRSPLRGLALADFTEGKLLSYQLAGTQKSARGGMAVLIDASGSMAGERSHWANAIGFSLLQVARKQGRPFRSIVFSSRQEQLTFDFTTPADFTATKMFGLLSAFYGGGTAYQEPLDQALAWLEKDWADRKGTRSDMLLVTDGICQVDPGWKAAFAERLDAVDGRLHSIVLGVPAREPVTSLSNGRVFEVQSLSIHDAAEVFKGVID
jgi:uncharacterized protein with von Willebrand factor type A (vWA) domain